MPNFHPLGFFVPFTIAVIYFPRALVLKARSTITFFAIAGVLSYLCPIKHTDGVGVWPIFLVLMVCYLLFWLICQVPPEKRIPACPALCLGFMSVVIPDTLLTMETFGTTGTVGGMGLSDGLIKFWLIPVPIVVSAWVLSEWVYSKDRNTPFCWRNTLCFHISPNPKHRRRCSVKPYTNTELEGEAYK